MDSYTTTPGQGSVKGNAVAPERPSVRNLLEDINLTNETGKSLLQDILDDVQGSPDNKTKGESPSTATCILGKLELMLRDAREVLVLIETLSNKLRA